MLHTAVNTYPPPLYSGLYFRPPSFSANAYSPCILDYTHLAIAECPNPKQAPTSQKLVELCILPVHEALFTWCQPEVLLELELIGNALRVCKSNEPLLLPRLQHFAQKLWRVRAEPMFEGEDKPTSVFCEALVNRDCSFSGGARCCGET